MKNLMSFDFSIKWFLGIVGVILLAGFAYLSYQFIQLFHILSTLG